MISTRHRTSWVFRSRVQGEAALLAFMQMPTTKEALGCYRKDMAARPVVVGVEPRQAPAESNPNPPGTYYIGY